MGCNFRSCVGIQDEPEVVTSFASHPGRTMSGPGDAQTSLALAEPVWRSDVPERTCSVNDCSRPASSRGWCYMHYSRWKRHGDPLRPPTSNVITADAFWSKTEPDGACLVWTGYIEPSGYGRTYWERRRVLAHRLAFFLRLGRWPNSDLRHLCNNPRCVLHVVEGSHSENMRDMVAAGTHNMARKTSCKRGHEFTEENTRINKVGARRCRACDREDASRRRRMNPKR